MKDLRDILGFPRVYQTFQKAGGFFGARLKTLNKYLPIANDARIVDVGCGPGYLREYLPPSCFYFGFDTDPRYIDRACATLGPRDTYQCRIFNAAAAEEVAPVDVIMMNGLLHHLTDDEARALLAASLSVLKPSGRIFTLDGCYLPAQSWLERKLLDWDRGQHVRSPEQYRALFPESGVSLSMHVDRDLSWISYTFLSMVATRN